MNELARTLIIIGLLVVMCVIYYIYRRSKKPFSDNYIRKGNDYVKEKNYDEAINCYQKAIEVGKYGKGSRSSALDNICLCYLEKNDYQKGEQYALEAMSISSTDYVAKLLYGKILYNTLRFEEAVKHYENFVDNKASAATVYSMLALCYANLGKTQEANNAVSNAEKNKYEGISELRKQVKKIAAQNKASDKDKKENETIKIESFENSMFNNKNN